MFRKRAVLESKAAVLALSAIACAIPAPSTAQSPNSSPIEAYYSIRRTPIWFAGRAPTAAAAVLPQILRRAPLDGLNDGPVLASQVEQAIRAVALNPAVAMQVDRVLSVAWVRYVQTLEAPLPGFEYGDERLQPRIEKPADILTLAAEPQLQQLQQVQRIASVNPIYAKLRDALWNESIASGTKPSPAAIANLGRIRAIAPLGKYLVVNAASAMLYMFDHGQQVDSMRIIVGKRETPTPLVVSTIYYATLNPYWNVPANLVQSLIAARVLAQGMTYLQLHKYQVVTKYSADASELPPTSIDWKAVANGKADAMVRQMPGPANSMGKLKFGFSNSRDIYLHDTPEKALFQDAGRLLSNGCIRLEDAQRLGRWLLGHDAVTGSSLPEQHELLPDPVPIYVTYLTMQVEDGKTSFIPDAYGRDPVMDAQAAGGR